MAIRQSATPCGRRWPTAVPIIDVPLATRNEPEVQLSAVRCRRRCGWENRLYVEVVLDANHDDEGQIEVFRAGIA